MRFRVGAPQAQSHLAVRKRPQNGSRRGPLVISRVIRTLNWVISILA